MTTTITSDAPPRRAPDIQTRARLLRPLTENAYRVLGLDAAATQAEIYEAAAARRRALRLERATPTPCDVPWLGALTRTEGAVRDALGRLAHPSQRIRERLFWFFDARAADGAAADATRDATAHASHAQESAAARHDAALTNYARALQSDAEIRDGDGWTEALQAWSELVVADGFWSLLLATDLKGDFEKLATHDELRSLRRETLALVAAPLFELARDALLVEDVAACGRALAVLRAASLPTALVVAYESELLGPVEDDFESRCQESLIQFAVDAFKASDDNERIRLCNQTLSTFKDDLRPRLRGIVVLAGAESHITRRACATAASFLRQLAGGLPSRRKDVAWRLLEQAWRLAPPGSEVESAVADALRREGRGDCIVARTDDEYDASLPALVQPQTETFASYIDDGARAKAWHLDTGSVNGGLSWVGIAVLSVIFGLCGWYGASRPSVQTNLRGLDMSNYRPPGMNINLDIPPLPPPTTMQLDPRSRMPSVSVAELRQKLKRGRVVIVDTRSRQEYEAGHLPGAIWMPEDQIAARHTRLPRRVEVVVYGDMKYSAIHFIALQLRVSGVRHVSVLDGGYEAWRAEQQK